MPEGDSVWRTARRLDRDLSGHLLARSDFRVPQHATADLAGRHVLGTGTHGKHLFTRFDDQTTLHTHLRMDGEWAVLRPGRRLPTRLAPDVRVLLVAGLLDQRTLAGLGNLWVNELLFVRGHGPWTPAGDVDAGALVATAARMLRQSITVRGNGQVTTGDPRPGHEHWVYGRSGQPCRRCRTLVRYVPERAGDAERRATWWCPHCQPG